MKLKIEGSGVGGTRKVNYHASRRKGDGRGSVLTSLKDLLAPNLLLL